MTYLALVRYNRYLPLEKEKGLITLFARCLITLIFLIRYDVTHSLYFPD